MFVLKCKMCGADIQAEEGATTAKCGFCRTLQTVPVIKSDNEDLRGLYNRANILRLKCEFDKAEDIYEKILLKDDTQSEAYYGVLLCKYGIEYVDDPASGRRIPTCHRASYEALTADEYYKLALKNASPEQREIYQSEAAYIDGVQRQILAESSHEEPYDVFICYKESDNGVRTRDSVIANDIYHQLTAEGFKVFYSAVTLEDKLGSNYEPVIFSAINSAKVMLAIGTKPEYLNAVWVRNEWSRYLKILKNDRRKLLIPCYKDMDAYELPEEFAHLQAQDMGKIGFITDIIRGIKKVLESFKEKPAVNNITNVTNVTNRTTNVTGGNASAAPAATTLLERAFMFAEDGDFASADRYAEKVLDANPKEAEAYLVKLLAELRINKRENLQNLSKPFTASKNCEKVLRFGDAELKKEIEGYNSAVAIRMKETEIAEQKRKAKELAEKAEREQAKKQALQQAREQEKLRLAELVRKRKTISGLKNLIAYCAGCIFAVKTDGRVIYAGQSDNRKFKPEEVLQWRDIVAISAGSGFLIGVKADGTVLYTGNDAWGNCKASKWKDIVSVYTSAYHTVGLRKDGTVVATGEKDSGQCNVQDWKDIKYISGRWKATFGINSDGEVLIAGIADGSYDIRRWKDTVSLCYGGGVGLKSNGKLNIISSEEEKDMASVVEKWSDIVDVISHDYRCIIGLKRDGSVVWWADEENEAESVMKNLENLSSWRDIIAIEDVGYYVIGFKSDGTLVAYNDEVTRKIADWKLFDSADTVKEERIANLIEEDKSLTRGKRKKEIANMIAHIKAQLK